MAIYHLHCDIIGRTSGGSAVAAAAYRATEKITDRTTGERHDYTRKEKALYSEILTAKNAPKWARNRAELWNRVEEKENRKNSQFCRSFDIALIKEFDFETNKKLLRLWIYKNYVSRGLAADAAIHGPHVGRDGESNNNIHAHVLATTRKLTKAGWGEKDREANDREFLQKVRTSWAEIVNAEFERRGMSERIDERTLEAQGIDREPQQHQGKAATAMERRGETPDRKKYKSQDQGEEIAITDEELENELLYGDGGEYVRNLMSFRESLRLEEEQKAVDNYLEEITEKTPAEKVTDLKKAAADPERTPEAAATEKRPEAAEAAPQIPAAAAPGKTAENPAKKLPPIYLELLHRVTQMTPQQWAEFTKNIDHLEYNEWSLGELAKEFNHARTSARTMWVERNAKPIEQHLQNVYQQKAAALKKYQDKKPEAVREPPNIFEKVFKTYTTADGQIYDGSDYAAYKRQQEQLIAKWENGRAVPESECQVARTELQNVRDKKYDEVRQAIERHHPTLLQKMKTGAKKLLETSPVFVKFRAMRNAWLVKREEKNKQLEQWRSQERAKRSQERDKDLGQTR